jgi:hypothetical protein
MNSPSSLEEFHQFFEHCVGTWNSERTYHYLSQQQIERSHTNFVIDPLNADQKQQVLADNHYEYESSAESNIEACPGFHLAFATVSEHGEAVSQALNMLFVTKKDVAAAATIQPETSFVTLSGDYLRDRAYEESRPIVSQFQFEPSSRELLMTTTYSQVVSVDSITLITPNLRIRRILNYRRPVVGSALSELLLVGFGVEQKTI